MGDEEFKRILVHSFALRSVGLKIVPLLKSFIANVLKCRACLTTKFNCVCVTMCSLVISPFSRDYIKWKLIN